MSSFNVKTYIKLHTPDGRVQKILTSVDRHSILESLPKLFEHISSPTQLGSGFSLDVGVSNKTQVFIVRERKSYEGNECLIADVFAVWGSQTPDEAFNLALSHYGSYFTAEEDTDRGSLTPYSSPDGCSVNGESECVAT